MRTIIANATISLDGCTAGTEPHDMSWLITHALDERGRAHFAGVYGGATTALVGRTNFEGFDAYWPPVAVDPAAHPVTAPTPAGRSMWRRSCSPGR